MPEWSLETPPPAPGSSPAPQPSPPAGSAKRRAGRRLLWAGVGLLLVVVGALVGFYIARSQSGDQDATLTSVREELGRTEAALSQSEQRNWDYYRVVEALRIEIEALEAGATGETVPGQGTTSTTGQQPVVFGGTYGDGVYLVGEDIAPGTYDGVVVAGLGYWARLKGTDGAVGSIITNAVLRGPFILTIIESDTAVELRGVQITAR